MNTRIFSILLATILLCGFSGCYRRDIQVLQVKVPGMKNNACATLIYQAFINKAPQSGGGFVEGVREVKPDLASHIVSVRYDSTKIAIKNIEYLICDAGFEANGNPPKPGTQEKLPKECK